jgi:Zn-finger nucleic acid-binding protein
MQSLNRASVEFDMCPTCRGVWLDRGELEKIIERVRADGAGVAAAPERRAEPPRDYREQAEYGERGEHGERGEYGERGERGYDARGRRKRGGFDLFDIFD